MARYITGDSREQLNLPPASVDELIPEDHLVRVIDLYVDALNFEALGFERARSASTGRPGYHPDDMLRLYLYGYLQKIRSSRRLERECQRNIDLMWLLNRLTPDFKTIAEFRRKHPHAFRQLRRHFIRFCREAAFEISRERLRRDPEAMARRRASVEYPFGTLKDDLMGSSGCFLVRGMEKIRGEMSLAVHAYNLKRLIQHIGAKVLMARLSMVPA